MDDLILDQTNIARKIKASYNSFKDLGDGATLGILGSRLTVLNDNWQKFENNHKEMLATKTKNDLTREYFANNFFDVIETAYADARGHFWDHKTLLEHGEDETNSHVSNQTAIPILSRKLPTIPVPKFNGEASEWMSSRDMFTAIVVHSQLNDVEKLIHLRDSLSGDSLFLIKNLSISEQNFNVAWNKLLTHYNNNRRIIYGHVTALLNIPCMKAGTAKDLRALFNSTIDVVESLKSLGSPVDSWDHLIVPLITSRLDQRSLMAWEDSLEHSTEPSTFAEVKEFLQKRLLTLEAVNGAGSSKTSNDSQNNKPKYNKPKSFNSHNTVKQDTKSYKTSCACCNQQHYISSCNSFKSKSLDKN